MRRLVAIHVLPAMRLVLPAFVCSVGNRVVAMAASLLGSRCSFIASCPLVARLSCRMPYINPAIGRRFRAGGCRSLPSLMTCAHTQELQRTLPGARRISFADEPGVKLWARSQWTKAIDGDAAAHERKSPGALLLRGCYLGWKF